MSSLITSLVGDKGASVGVALEDASSPVGAASAGVIIVFWLSGTWVMIRECRQTGTIMGGSESWGHPTLKSDGSGSEASHTSGVDRTAT